MPLIAMTSEQKDEYMQLMDHDTRYRIVVCGKNDSRKKRLLTGKCTFLDDFVSAVAKKDVMTSMGQMAVEKTLEYIREKNTRVTLLVYDDPQALAASIRTLMYEKNGNNDNSNDNDNNNDDDNGHIKTATLPVVIVVPDEDSRYELKVFYRYHGLTTTFDWYDMFSYIGKSYDVKYDFNEQKANIIIHASAAFGKKYHGLFELLAHAVSDAEYCDVKKMREYAFSLAAMLDNNNNKKERRAGNGYAIHQDAVEGITEVKCLAKITEWVK